MEQATGFVHDKYEIKWFAKWLRESYSKRVLSPLEFTVEEFRPVRRAVLLNCLDTLYGHCLLKLLNAQYYIDNCRQFDLIVLVPRFLRWMVPEGVASIWTVDLPLERGIEWNDWLATEIRRRTEHLEMCWLSVAFPHPHPDDYNIERFTRVHPFDLDEWEARLERPTVTFIWREDRCWQNSKSYSGWQPLGREVSCRFGFLRNPIVQQRNRVALFAESLRQTFPQLDFAIVGLGTSGDFAKWISDLRVLQIDDKTEKSWCERYAQSHVVIGLHGSNMLLPSGHAGAVVELMPSERWGNVSQDLLFRQTDSRETLFSYRLVSLSINPYGLATLVKSILQDYGMMMLNMGRKFCLHQSKEFLSLAERRSSLSSLL
jgi:hypothetical protein